MVALWARGLGRIHVFPGRRPAQDVVHFLEFGIGFVGDPFGDVLDVGTGGTGKSKTARPLLNARDVGTSGTEEQHS